MLGASVVKTGGSCGVVSPHLFWLPERCGLQESAAGVARKSKNDYRNGGSSSFVLPQEEADTRV